MNNPGLLTLVALLLISFIESSCTAIGEFFNVGTGLGIFIVAVLILIIPVIVDRLHKK